MGKKIDLSGQRYGKLTVLHEAGKDNKGNYKWTCICDCGNTCVITSWHLRSGGTVSCGCYRHDWQYGMIRKHGYIRYGKRERLYCVWSAMKARCYNPKHIHYKNYGGRGISICPEWRNDYQSFREWAYANGYDETAASHQCTLDRINNDGNYEPINCRFSDPVTQANNRRNSKKHKEAQANG